MVKCEKIMKSLIKHVKLIKIINKTWKYIEWNNNKNHQDFEENHEKSVKVVNKTWNHNLIWRNFYKTNASGHSKIWDFKLVSNKVCINT